MDRANTMLNRVIRRTIDYSPVGSATTSMTDPEDGFDRTSTASIADTEITTTTRALHSDERGDGLDTGNLWNIIADKGRTQFNPLQYIDRLEKGGDNRILQTFKKGKQRDLVQVAPIPKVGLVFLPGADKPTVNRLEETKMVEEKPDQRDSSWRVNTASALLTTWTVSNGLSVVTVDGTWMAIHRARGSQNLTIDDPERDTVTIDSDAVSVVNELRDAKDAIKYDLYATLIEVDARSFVQLIRHFTDLLQNSSAQSPSTHLDQLKDMIEDARFFCVRSPILFRMSTRLPIAKASDIRYGTDDEQGFCTLYPSKGIQQLISISAAYFNSLDPEGMDSDDSAQSLARPRFLQMLVLLLSMLDSSSLIKMKEFLRTTYKIKAEREHLEILFLKTIPLTSINATVFLTALVPAVFGWPVQAADIQDESFVWRKVLIEMAKMGYLLPGSVDDLGHENDSWALKWPEHGFHSSQVFAALQYHGKDFQGFNELQQIRTGSYPGVKELTVHLTFFENPWIINAEDYARIHCLDTGKYIVKDARNWNHELVLHVKSESLSTEINKAIVLVNKAMRKINISQARRSSGKLVKFTGRKPNRHPVVLAQDVPAVPTITRHEAWLEQEDVYGNTCLAVTWKCDGRTIARTDMFERMGRPVRRIEAILERFEDLTNGDFDRRDELYVRIKTHLASHHNKIRVEVNTAPVPDTPIQRSIHPYDKLNLVNSRVWFAYVSEYVSDGRRDRLHLRARRDVVKKVAWSSDDAQAEVELATIKMKFVVAPIRPELRIPIVDEIDHDREDIVILAGRYMIVAELSETIASKTNERMLRMTNWLEILSTEEVLHTRRGRNREREQEHEKLHVVSIFV